MFATVLTYLYWIWDWLLYLLTLPLIVYLINIVASALLNLLTDKLFPVIFRWNTVAEQVEFPIVRNFYLVSKQNIRLDGESYQKMIEYTSKILAIFLLLYLPVFFLIANDIYYLPRIPWLVTISLKQMLVVSNIVGTFRSIQRDNTQASILPAYEIEALVAIHTMGFNVYVLPLIYHCWSSISTPSRQ